MTAAGQIQGSGPDFVIASAQTGRSASAWPYLSFVTHVRRVAEESKGTPGRPTVVNASRSARSPGCHCPRAGSACHAGRPGALAKVHQEVARPLDGPGSGRMGGDAQD